MIKCQFCEVAYGAVGVGVDWDLEESNDRSLARVQCVIVKHAHAD